MAHLGQKLHTPATYQDLLEVPDHLIAEILDGELIVSPRPAAPHAEAGSALGAELRGAFGRKRRTPDQPGGWWILYEPELHLNDDVLVPDLAAWTRERLPVIPDVPFFSLAPDWVCKILSPSNSHVDRVRKMPIYAREQTPWLWLIDPKLKTVEAYRLEGRFWLLLGTWHGDVPVRIPPFEALELDLFELWLQPVEEPSGTL